MANILLSDIYGKQYQIKCQNIDGIKEFYDGLEGSVAAEDYYLLNNGRRVCSEDALLHGGVYRVVPRLLGGKGGFGSMLRAIGAQIEKTTNREACRDLSGRRMRDLNNEKKLREWVARQAEREREKEERRKARLERRKALPKHNFSDPNYEHQMSTMSEDIRDAVNMGLQKPSTSTSASRKRKAREEPDFDVKKASEWLGMDINIEDFENSDSDSDSASESSPAPAAADSQSEDSNPATELSQSGNNKPQSSQSQDSCLNDKVKQTQLEGESDNDKSEICTAAPVEIKDNGSKCDKVIGGNASPKDIENTNVTATGDAAPVQSTDLLHKLQEHPPKVENTPNPEVKAEVAAVDLDSAASQDYLESLGLDALKQALLTRGLKCSGTLQDRAARLWAVRGLAPEQIPASFYPKPAKGKKK